MGMNRHRPLLPALVCWVLSSCSDKVATQTPDKPQPEAVVAPLGRASVEQPQVEVPEGLSFLIIGGGADPMSNQVSLAQDAEHARSLLAGTGLTLFASGPRAQLALDAPVPERPATLRERLAVLFAVPGSLATRYAPADLQIDGPATREQVLGTLEKALYHGGSEPLLVYATCHGERGQSARDNAMSLWGGQSLEVSDVADALAPPEPDLTVRPVRFVITSCYGGGFADMIFREADEQKGLTPAADRCGLFAAPWDDEASGCDPNPNRRDQESYAIHFWHALEGEDRTHHTRLKEIDLDADGKVGLLEAHTWARIHAASFDIPTNTSERYLRHAAQRQGKVELDPVAAPEEVAVIRALGGKLELDSEQAARNKLAEIDSALNEVRSLVEEAQAREDEAYQLLRIGLLERWPLLEHPWEERTQRMLAREGKRITRMLTESALADAQTAALHDLDEVTAQHDLARVQRARVLRLVQAFETLRLASGLKLRGGEPWARFERIRSCERWSPPLRTRTHTAKP